MLILIAGLVLFFAAHAVSIVGEPWRDGMVAKLGELPWKASYSVVSLVGLVLVALGYAEARIEPIILYAPPTALRHVALLLLALVFPLLLATYLPGRIKTATKHPTLVAVKVWAFAHLLANGSLADVLLFGSFLAWAIADRISLKRRAPRPLPGAPPSALNDALAIVLGLGIYALFVFWLHARAFGVSPIG
jgi:uncharacterized membrane protein